MEGVHPVASDPIPAFVAAPGETDVLFSIAVIFCLITVFLIGIFYLRLHALPEQIAHKTNKIQLQLVAILGLLALFTHNHLYWIAGLLLAFIELPDFLSPMGSMARSLEKIADREEEEPPSLSEPGEDAAIMPAAETATMRAEQPEPKQPKGDGNA